MKHMKQHGAHQLVTMDDNDEQLKKHKTIQRIQFKATSLNILCFIFFEGIVGSIIMKKLSTQVDSC